MKHYAFAAVLIFTLILFSGANGYAWESYGAQCSACHGDKYPDQTDTATDDQTTEDQTTDDQTTEDQTTDDQTTDDQSTDDQDTDDQGTDDQDTDDQGFDDHGTDDQGFDDHGTDDQGFDDHGTDDQGFDDHGTNDHDSDHFGPNDDGSSFPGCGSFDSGNFDFGDSGQGCGGFDFNSDQSTNGYIDDDSESGGGCPHNVSSVKIGTDGSSGPFETTTTTDSGFTIFHPTNMEGGHPVVLWEVGTGIRTTAFTSLLENIASYGFVVVAPDDESINSEECVSFITEQNNNPDSTFYQMINTNSIGSMPSN